MPPSSSTSANANHNKKIQCVVLGAADAGKTSLLRRYFRQTFDSGRVPTVGSDFYSRRITLPMDPTATRTNTADNDNDRDGTTTPPKQQLLLQMFDTPGEVPDRSRRRANEQDDHEQQRHRQALLAAFAQRMDGVLLVYDMTSTTSFVQLRQWHAQWRKHSSNQPILIVGNKRDLMMMMTMIPNQNNNNNNNNTPTTTHDHDEGNGHRPTMPQRDVMGLAGSFTGKDFRYEYRVDHQVVLSNPPPTQTQTHQGATTPPPTTKNPTSTSSTSNTAYSLHLSSLRKQKPPRSSNTAVSPYITSTSHRHHQISTFSSTTDAGILWTQDQDGTYLDSLLTTEDNSNPDRDMVKLWCMRNGLQHVEVSCLEQQGDVDTAMETLVQLVLEARRSEQQQQLHPTEDMTIGSTVQGNRASNVTSYSGRNETLDLLERYRPKDSKCCFCFPPIRLRFG